MTPDLLDALKVDRIRVRSEVALHAGRVLVVQPEQFADMAAADILRAIPYTSTERARQILREARVDGMRRGSELRRDQRIAMARQLARLAKERQP